MALEEITEQVTRVQASNNIGAQLLLDELSRDHDGTLMVYGGYTWVAYANDASGTNISLTQGNLPYTGYAYNKDVEAADISDPSVYTWHSVMVHNHDADYSAISHNHDADYSAISHNHDADYSAISHNHGEYVADVVDSDKPTFSDSVYTRELVPISIIDYDASTTNPPSSTRWVESFIDQEFYNFYNHIGVIEAPIAPDQSPHNLYVIIPSRNSFYTMPAASVTISTVTGGVMMGSGSPLIFGSTFKVCYGSEVPDPSYVDHLGEYTLTVESIKGYSGYKLPYKDGTEGQVLSTDGNGNVSWVTP